MFRAAVFLIGSSLFAAQSFEPAKLQSGTVKPVKIMTTTAGMVLVELTVDERGMVRSSRPVHDVAPFTELVRETAMSWRFDPARENRSRTESHVLVIGLYRPEAMLFALSEPPKPPPREGSDSIPFPTEVAVPPYPPNRIGSANVLVELDLREDGSVAGARALSPETGFDDSAISTARGWRFRPAKRGRREVPARVYMIVSYRQPL